MKRKFKVQWTNIAEKDLLDIIDYISEDSPETALRILKMFQESADNLFMFPERGRVIPELKDQGIAKYREIVISPWRLMYIIDSRNIYITALIDSRRNIEDILLRRVLSQRI